MQKCGRCKKEYDESDFAKHIGKLKYKKPSIYCSSCRIHKNNLRLSKELIPVVFTYESDAHKFVFTMVKDSINSKLCIVN